MIEVELHESARKRVQLLRVIAEEEHRGCPATTEELARRLPWEQQEAEDQLRVVATLDWARERDGAWLLTERGGRATPR